MNTKAFITGFNTVNSLFNGISATKRIAHEVLDAPINIYEVTVSFLAGAKQAWNVKNGTCRMLAHDVRSSEEG